MYVYRILHIPTELYYQPVKGRWKNTRTNFGSNGKVYIAKKPTLKDLGRNVAMSEIQSNRFNIDLDQHGTFDVCFDDYDIIKFKLVEVNEN